MNVIRDYMAARFIARGQSVDGYSRIYFCSNEDIMKAVKNLDIRDKNVMTVLASSDQLFTFNSLGAKEVDAFDHNILTIYYYYLRKWSIKYNDQLYPEFVMENDYERLKKLLSLVKVDENNPDEAQALTFWKKHATNRTDFRRMFYRDFMHKTVSYDQEDVKPSLDKPVDFRQVDMTHETDFDRQYDLLYLSNIIEWEQLDKKKLTAIKNNALRLINDDGLVLCTSFFSTDGYMTPQVRQVFEEDFDKQVLSQRSYCLRKK